MDITAVKTRLYVSAALGDAREIPLSVDHAHFLGNVLRLKPNDRIAVFNATDGQWSGPLTTLKKRHARVLLDHQSRPGAPEAGPWLVFAPLKKNRTQMVIEKATELGVERVFPVITENTNGGRTNSERMALQAIEAAEQCERLSIPVIDTPQSLADLLDGWPQNRRLLVGDETGGGRAIADIISSNPKKSKDYGILIGPEGGFKSAELDRLKAADFCTLMDLGPRILRAETAAIVALGCLQALT